MKDNKGYEPGNECEGKRIEWTGAGGDYFLAVVVAGDQVIAECWGTQKEIAGWMEANWPGLRTKYVPMALGWDPAARQAQPPTAPAKQKTARWLSLGWASTGAEI